MVKKLLQKYNSLPLQIKATFWFLVCTFLQKSISTITMPIFTRLLSPDEYGQYTVFNSWMQILEIFVTLHLHSSVYSQGMIKFSDDRNVYSSSLQGLAMTISAGWTVIYLLFHDFWNSLFGLTTVQILAMLLIMWTSAAFGFWATEQRITLRYVHLVAMTAVVSVAKPVVGITFILLAQDKVTARILGIALVNLLAYTGLFVLQVCRGKVFCSKKYWLHALTYNIPLVPHYLSQTVLNSADRIMIRDLIDSGSAGIYGAAYSIGQITTLFMLSLGQTLNPWEYQKIKAKKTKEISKITYPTLIMLAILNLFFMAFAPEIVRIFASESYYDAIWVIPPITMSTYFMCSYERFAKIALYHEETKPVALATTVVAALNVVLNYIFIPLCGYYAAGYTTLVCYMVFAVFHYLLMRKMCRKYLDGEYVYDTKTLLCITGVFLALGFGYTALYRNTPGRYALTAVLLVALFVKRRLLINYVSSLLSVKKEKKEDA